MEEYDARGSADPSAEPRFLVIGRILKPHGVRGEVRVEIHTDLPERFTWLESVYVGKEDPRLVAVEGVRFHKEWALLKLAGYDDRETAATLRSEWLQVPEEESIPLEEGEYFLYQLAGLQVHTEAGLYLGDIRQVLETGANNVFVVKGPLGEILIPDIGEVVLKIDFQAKRMLIRPLEGLLPRG
ncbi:MAG: ribosome maturation factor RimM [Chloroflexota bacterium]|jgi:16S rRNA processing protein RimM